MVKSPSRVTIFSYQVGFGDCFLLRFDYPDRPRHVLIDFGTTKLPDSAPKDQLKQIALDIKKKVGGKRLDAVVATHRHADHISGFATNAAGSASGDIIAELEVGVVLQPWTEQLDLKANALGPKVGTGKQLQSRRLGLMEMHETSASILRMLDSKAMSSMPKALAAQMRFIGEDNLKNKPAVENLATMGKKRVYAYHGSNSGLGAVLPGIKVHVLGPPTLKQSEKIRKQRAKDPNEFWHLTLRRLTAAQANLDRSAALFPGHPTMRASKLPLSLRWIASRLKAAQGEQLLGILRALDEQMNNTSLILLFEAGKKKKKLLFPGDAQIENWQHALASEKYMKLLQDVDLYKVGHHGSLNATPKTMWAAFKKRGPKTAKGRLTSMLSTLPGKHGHEKSGTEVPRTTLLSALKTESELHSTHTMNPNHLCEEVTIDL